MTPESNRIEYKRSFFDFTPSFLVVTFPLELVADETKDEPINEPINEPAKTLETELLAVIREKPTMTKEDFAREIGKSRATVTRIIHSLLEQGKIKRVGSRKTGHWEVVDK